MYKNLIMIHVAIGFLAWLLSVSYTVSMPSWVRMLVWSAFPFSLTRIESFNVSLTFSSLFMKSVVSLT